MARIRLRRSVPFKPFTRQHQRVLTYLFVGTLVFGAYYLYTARPIDPFAVPFHDHESYMNDVTHKHQSRQSYDWRTAPFINKVESYIPLPSGQPRNLPRIQSENFVETHAQRKVRERRRVFVREEFESVWESYRLFAWGQDELKPVSGGGEETFGGWAATLVDSLDTLWIMGLKDEFREAVEAVAAIDFGKTNLKTISVFETTIRYLGGFISAYDLSHEPVLLEKAIQLGEMLYRAFDTTNNTPLGWLDIEAVKTPGRTEFPAEYSLCFACLGSLTMEFTRLAQITSEPKYYDIVARISILMAREQSNTRLPGLWPTFANPATQLFNNSYQFSIGALADSAYEYFPKMHILLGGLDPIYETMYNAAATQIDKHLLFRPMVPDTHHGEDLLVCGDASAAFDGPSLIPQGQHLTCFVGGMFALAGRLFSLPSHVSLGAKLTQGCIYAYAAMPSGIMPESFSMEPCASRESCPWNQTLWQENPWRVASSNDPPGFLVRDKRYLLRPEAIESVFILYRVTGDRRYLDDAWDMFVAIVRASRTPYANGQVLDVTVFTPDGSAPGAAGTVDSTTIPNVEDKMESFWTAETLKYFYLIFSRPDMVSLDEWVFNTEAHPFRRPRMRGG
ncbi:glycoside hydrolase family 47 protein [Plenodomus tracheiphilus IPT5]|uniref:alpha-1,2-Mannosidase n=1 Tax=Plenodomus tracheiphilus IPT5 TaxID=1408161 RepID=A0A6A7B6W6_9PLEO|nr:glycoside hydrolase family 47 protein [Plenodomus tracheiphilus IPT5]